MASIDKMILARPRASWAIAGGFALVAVLTIVSGCGNNTQNPLFPDVAADRDPLLAPAPAADTVRVQAGDIIPGWAMEFVDFKVGETLTVRVVQRNPREEGTFGPARGAGRFSLKKANRCGHLRGSLFMEEASWLDWPDYPEGYPESAEVRGWARIGLSRHAFTLSLESNGWPHGPLDRAVLTIDGIEGSFALHGELHHGRIRAL